MLLRSADSQSCSSPVAPRSRSRTGSWEAGRLIASAASRRFRHDSCPRPRPPPTDDRQRASVGGNGARPNFDIPDVGRRDRRQRRQRRTHRRRRRRRAGHGTGSVLDRRAQRRRRPLRQPSARSSRTAHPRLDRRRRQRSRDAIRVSCRRRSTTTPTTTRAVAGATTDRRFVRAGPQLRTARR